MATQTPRNIIFSSSRDSGAGSYGIAGGKSRELWLPAGTVIDIRSINPLDRMRQMIHRGKSASAHSGPFSPEEAHQRQS